MELFLPTITPGRVKASATLFLHVFGLLVVSVGHFEACHSHIQTVLLLNLSKPLGSLTRHLLITVALHPSRRYQLCVSSFYYILSLHFPFFMKSHTFAPCNNDDQIVVAFLLTSWTHTAKETFMDTFVAG